MTYVEIDPLSVRPKVFVRGETITFEDVETFQPYSNSVFSHPSSLAFKPYPEPDDNQIPPVNGKSNEGYLAVANEYSRSIMVYTPEGRFPT